MANGHTAPPRVIVGQRHYVRGPAPTKTGCTKCLLIFATIFFLLSGLIMTAVGHARKSFWDEGDDWCSFCKEDRLETEATNARLRVAGPIMMAIGGILLIASIVYCKRAQGGNAGAVLGQGGTTMTATTTATYQPPSMQPAAGTVHYPPAQTTQNYPPPQSYPGGPPPTTQGYPPPQPYQPPVAGGYPPAGPGYPTSYPGGAPPPYPVPSAPPNAPEPGFAPPSYDQAQTGKY